MKTLKMMCGLPRSGKSTWIKQNKTNEVVVSADDIRYLVYNQRFWDEGEPLMWSIRNMILRMLMEQGVDIIVDETNTTPKRRLPIIALAQKYNYQINCIKLTTSKNVCIERAIAENDNLIKPVIERMANQFVEPDASEGFDNLINV